MIASHQIQRSRDIDPISYLIDMTAFISEKDHERQMRAGEGSVLYQMTLT